MPSVTYDDDGNLIVSTDDLMRLFGVSKFTAAAWADKGCPKISRGKWKLKDVIAWRGLQRLGDGGTEESDAVKKLRADAEYKDAKAKQEAVRLQEMLGNLIPIDLMKDEWAMMFTEIRQQLLKLPNDIRAKTYVLYPECSEEVTAIAEETIRQCLERLGNGNYAGTEESVEEIDPSDGE